MCDESDPFFDEGEQSTYTSYECPHCGSFETGGNYDLELYTEEEQKNMHIWICLNCQRGFDL